MGNYPGSSGNDTIKGSTGADRIDGYGGNDSITADKGNDTVYGGDGRDTIDGGDGDDSLYGDAGNDSVLGGKGSDRIYGGTGDDTIAGGDGSDFLFGDAGNDLLTGGNDAWDEMYGGDGNDTIISGNANDNWAYGGTGDDSITMGTGWDLAYGGAGNDSLYGGSGNDTLHGGADDDSVIGGTGSDTVTGGSGKDTLDGGADADRVHGGAGNDLIYGGAGNDTLEGDTHTMSVSDCYSTGSATGTQTFVNSGPVSVKLYWINTEGTAVFVATLAPGASITQPGGAGYNWMLTETSSGTTLDHIEGSAGNATYSYGPNFEDTIHGGDGSDQISGNFGNDLLYGDGGNDTIFGGQGNDTVVGGDGNDSIALGDGDDVMDDWSNNGGNDTIDGGAGNDLIYGGGENDLIYGGTGNDTLSGGAGGDTIYGGAGDDMGLVTDDHDWDVYDLGENQGDQDTLWFGNYLSANGVSVTFTGTDAGTYQYAGGFASGTFTGVEAIGGTDNADTINAAADQDGQAIYAEGGNDRIVGGSGADSIEGGDGNDSVDGGAGNDTVEGGRGDDTLTGGAGDDSLTGGAGDDALHGGQGHDLFVFAKTGGHDTVEDFDMQLDGIRTIDQLDVSDLTNADGSPLTWHDITLQQDVNGNAVLIFPQNEVVLLQGVSPSQITKQMAHKMGMPCFAADTLIDTPQGGRPVQDLRAGDVVLTATGPMPVLWSGGRAIGPAELVARPSLQPVVIRRGALGNDRTLILSRQHALAIAGPEGPVLVRAAQLADLGQGMFRQARGRLHIAYHHILLPSHALIRANGAWAESLWPGPAGLAALGADARDQIARALPRIAMALVVPAVLETLYGPRALPALRARDLRRLAAICPPPTVPRRTVHAIPSVV